MLLFPMILGNAQVLETTTEMNVSPNTNTVRKRFTPPKGYFWVEEQPNSFGYFLSNFKLLPSGFPVRNYLDEPIENQQKHAAILNIDVGEKDLQQCADAWIRLYSEYLWSQKRYDEIGFHFTSGQFLSWNDYKDGIRTSEKNEVVTFKKVAKPDGSYKNFRTYLDLIFRYAGTISLDRESRPVANNADIKVGDYLITPGSPGHSVIIVGKAKNRSGKAVYLLAESYMPAQSVHILVNPKNYAISPWYELDINAPYTMTAKYIFKPTTIKRFYKLP